MPGAKLRFLVERGSRERRARPLFSTRAGAEVAHAGRWSASALVEQLQDAGVVGGLHAGDRDLDDVGVLPAHAR